MDAQIDTAEKFAEWSRRVKARRAENRTPEGRARLAMLIGQSREVADELRGIASDMELYADGIGRGQWYARKLGGFMDEVDTLIGCIEEQAEREFDDGRADG